jgi:pimeloyl-ACP methyl ester carboxylesterase
MRNLFCFVVTMFVLISCGQSDEEREALGAQSVLFLGEGTNQKLVVGLGGSEGGNAWATERWKPIRDKFIREGYAFLAVGYFGMEGTPEELDRISLEKVYYEMKQALQHEKVADSSLALIGGSKGAELALLLGSKYSDINCVVSIVGSHATFPALTFGAGTSSWSYNNEEVPYVPAPWASVPSMITGNLREAFEIMLEDTAAVSKALIKVENIRGPVLCMSASQDEMWPSAEMSALVMKRLDEYNFPYAHEHIVVEGGHMEPLDEFDQILDFLNKHYKK